jgi:hypothetical protein
MINKGFKTTATKEDLVVLRSEMTAGFERIEHLLLAEQKREIEDVKQRMKRLEDVLAASHQISQRPKSPEHPARGVFFPVARWLSPPAHTSGSRLAGSDVQRDPSEVCVIYRSRPGVQHGSRSCLASALDEAGRGGNA